MTTKGKMKIRYAVVQIDVPQVYLTADGEEPESEGWEIVQKNLVNHLARFQKTPTAPSAKFVEWEKE